MVWGGEEQLVQIYCNPRSTGERGKGRLHSLGAKSDQDASESMELGYWNNRMGNNRARKSRVESPREGRACVNCAPRRQNRDHVTEA